jgi:hypothetical protein
VIGNVNGIIFINNSITKTYDPSGTGWRRKSVTFTFIKNDYLGHEIFPHIYNADSVKNVKLEKGNKSTDWTPAPEDQVSDWSVTDTTSYAYIKNKPTTLTGYGISASDSLLTSNFQTKDNDLTAIAALTGTGFLKRTGTDIWALDTNVALQSDLTTAVNNLQIGGRNLIANRQTISLIGADYPSESTVSSIINSKGEKEITVTTTTTNDNGRAYRYQFIQSFFSKPIENKEYVFSFDYKTNHDGGMVKLDWRNAFGYSYRILENTNELWKRGYFVCDWRGYVAGSANLLIVSVKNNIIGNYASIRNIKLVEGNKGWDDSPAPEDQVSDWSVTDTTSYAYIKNKPTTLTGYGISASDSLLTSNFQAKDSDLTAIAALTGTGFLKRTGADTWSLDSSTYRPVGGSWTGASVPGIREFGFVSNNGQGEVAFKYDSSSGGVLNMIIDGEIYCTDNSYKVWHSGNFNPNNYLPLAGGTLSGNLFIPNNVRIIQNQASTSNYTTAIKWYKGGVSQNIYDPQIGQHNTGGTGTGAITILPYSTNIDP